MTTLFERRIKSVSIDSDGYDSRRVRRVASGELFVVVSGLKHKVLGIVLTSTDKEIPGLGSSGAARLDGVVTNYRNARTFKKCSYLNTRNSFLYSLTFQESIFSRTVVVYTHKIDANPQQKIQCVIDT